MLPAVANHFSSIGFVVESQDAFESLAMQAANAAEPEETASGFYLPWEVGSGIEIWAQATMGREVIGCNPHFAGKARMRIGVTQPFVDPSNALEGALEGWADPKPDAKEGAYPIRIDVPDFELAAESLELPAIVDVQIAAFAHTLRCHDDEKAFDAAQGKGAKMAPESLIPTGLFAPENAPHRAEAAAVGRVLAFERLVNPESHRAFFHVHVRTYGGELDVVADPEVMEGTPKVGGIVEGTFWLSGRIVR